MGSGKRRALLAIAVGAIATRVTFVGCDDNGSHIFSGEQYDPVLQCLEPVSSIDIVAGPEPGSCPPVCILSLPQDGGRVAFVSTLCGPYPEYPYQTDASGDPLCVAAMDAFKRDALCVDGGVVLPKGEAGVDAEAGAEAGLDAEAGAEAAADGGADGIAESGGDDGGG